MIDDSDIKEIFTVGTEYEAIYRDGNKQTRGGKR